VLFSLINQYLPSFFNRIANTYKSAKFLRIILILVGMAALLTAAILPPSPIALFLAAFFTGLPTVALSTRRWSPTAFICATIILSLPIWAISSFISNRLNCSHLLSVLPLLWAGVCLLISMWPGFVPLKVSQMQYADYIALSIASVFALPLITIFTINGSQITKIGEYYFMYPGSELDFSYHFGLVQQAIYRQSYPFENPLFAGVPNRYPSFIHLGLAGIAVLGEGPAAVCLWPILPIFMLAPTAMGFIAIYRLSELRTSKEISLLAAVYMTFVLVRIDHFLLPQAQSIAFGLLALLLYYLPMGARNLWRQWIIWTIIALLLVVSHTVSATVAVMLAASLGMLIIIRKKWNQIIPCVISSVIIIVAFLIMNHYPHYPPTEESISSQYLKQYFNVLVLPYLIPIAIGFAFLLGQRLTTPLAVAGFALMMLTVCYWAYGFTGNSHKKIFFTLFNAPRFALLGLFLLIPYFNYRSFLGWMLPILLLVSLLLYPNQVMRALPGQFTAVALSYSMKDVQMMHRELRDMMNHSILSNYTDLGPAAFSGCPIFIEEPSYGLYALDTVPESIANQRLADRTALFGNISPSQRLNFMRSNGIGALVVSGDLAAGPAQNFLPDGTFNFIKGEKWAIYKLNPATHVNADYQSIKTNP